MSKNRKKVDLREEYFVSLLWRSFAALLTQGTEAVRRWKRRILAAIFRGGHTGASCAKEEEAEEHVRLCLAGGLRKRPCPPTRRHARIRQSGRRIARRPSQGPSVRRSMGLMHDDAQERAGRRLWTFTKLRFTRAGRRCPFCPSGSSCPPFALDRTSSAQCGFPPAACARSPACHRGCSAPPRPPRTSCRHPKGWGRDDALFPLRTSRVLEAWVQCCSTSGQGCSLRCQLCLLSDKA